MLSLVLLLGNSDFRCSSGDGTLDFGVGNRAPVAQADSYAVTIGVTLQGRLAAEDADEDALEFAIVASPQLGSLELIDPESGDFLYTPESPGEDSFTFVADDSRAESDPATVSITVRAAAQML